MGRTPSVELPWFLAPPAPGTAIDWVLAVVEFLQHEFTAHAVGLLFPHSNLNHGGHHGCGTPIPGDPTGADMASDFEFNPAPQ